MYRPNPIDPPAKPGPAKRDNRISKQPIAYINRTNRSARCLHIHRVAIYSSARQYAAARLASSLWRISFERIGPNWPHAHPSLTGISRRTYDGRSCLREGSLAASAGDAPRPSLRYEHIASSVSAIEGKPNLKRIGARGIPRLAPDSPPWRQANRTQASRYCSVQSEPRHRLPASAMPWIDIHNRQLAGPDNLVCTE